MKFTNLFLVLALFLSCTKKTQNPSHTYPPYKLINSFSDKIKTETGLFLTSYGINNSLQKKNPDSKGIENFTASYSLKKTKNDEISISEARNLLIYVSECFLKEINSDPDVVPDLEVSPLTNDFIRVDLRFEDENRIELGRGVAIVQLDQGKIEYEGYKISEYRDRYPAVGKHYTIHEESYEDALEIVKKTGHPTTF